MLTMEYMRLINEALGDSLISPIGLEDVQGKLQGQPLYMYPELVAVIAALLGCRGEKLLA